MRFVAVLISAPVLVFAQTSCPFLPSESAPAIEFILPAKVFSSPIVDLPITFQGIRPIVTRKDVPYGSTPKITVKRYSSTPAIMYDETSKSVVITSSVCGADNVNSVATESSAFGRSSAGWMAMAATCIAGMVDERLRPIAATVVISAGLTVARARELQEVCMPTVEVVVEAPSAYNGALATCLAEINDPDVCPDPFPTYKTCSDPAPKCEVAIIGAGAGGLYTALR